MGYSPRSCKELDKTERLCVKQITSKQLPHSTENSTQYSVMNYMENNLKKSGYMYVYN